MEIITPRVSFRISAEGGKSSCNEGRGQSNIHAEYLLGLFSQCNCHSMYNVSGVFVHIICLNITHHWHLHSRGTYPDGRSNCRGRSLKQRVHPRSYRVLYCYNTKSQAYLSKKWKKTFSRPGR